MMAELDSEHYTHLLAIRKRGGLQSMSKSSGTAFTHEKGPVPALMDPVLSFGLQYVLPKPANYE